MALTHQIAKHLRDIHFGGNWTCPNLKETLADVTWQKATKQVYGFNSIATLVFHTNYYISAVLKVLQGNPLDAKDELSFNHPSINSSEDWKNLLDKTWTDAENFAKHIEQLSEDVLLKHFSDEKYGNYYRNLHGIIEHTHYHLGQIVLIKKLILELENNG